MKVSRAFLLLCLIFSGCNTVNNGLIIHSNFEPGENESEESPCWTLHGAVLSDDSIVGHGSIYFDGVDDYVEYPKDRIYFDGDYSISVWVKWKDCKMWNRIMDFNQDAPMSGNAVTWLIGRPAQGSENSLWFDQWVTYEGQAVESIVDQMTSPGEAYLGYDVKLDRWDHYVIVYDSSVDNPLGVVRNKKGLNVPYEGKVTFFLNGEKMGESYRCLKPQPISTSCNWLGRSRFAPDPFFNGWMDDFRIYDRKLGKKEINALYDLRNK